jgi:PAS domain S-box-containing protein
MDALFQALVQNSSDAIVTLMADGTIGFVSETSVRLLGFTHEERIGHSGFELIHPDDVASVRESFAACLHQPGVPMPTEYRMRRKDGAWRYMEAIAVNRLSDPAVAAVVVNYRDVTERRAAEDALRASEARLRQIVEEQKHTEQRLRRSEARYRSLIQGAAYGIYRSTLDGTILDANPALASMLGYTTEELQTLNMLDVYKSARDRAALIERYHARHSGGALSTDITWRKKDGTEIIVHVTARVVRLDDGMRCFEGIVEDITERRALEDQLRQAQKMEAVGRLARGVAHDFNNVLAAILGCSDLLAMRLEKDDPSRDDAEEIRKAAERGAALTRQLLAFSRSQALEAQLLDLNVAIAQMGSMLQRLAGESVKLDVRMTKTPVCVRIEPGLLEQVLLNLVVNGRDAMPAGGTVTVTVESIAIDGAGGRRYPALPDGEYARISVTDTGVGIDPATQPHIFEPFFTTKGPSKGTGLGLSIVYGIAKDAGGTVTFITAPERGTTFEVLLPLAVHEASKA